MKISDIVIPDRFLWAAEELKLVIRDIEKAFFNRPIPYGPARSIENVAGLPEMVIKGLNPLAKPINDLTREVFENEGVSRREVKAGVQTVRSCIQEMVTMFHDVWARPFPPDMAEAQALFSAVPERVLKQLHGLFSQVIGLTALDETLWAQHDTAEVKIYLELDLKEEFTLLTQWVKAREMENRIEIRLLKQRRRRSWLESAVLGFLLGWWIDE